MAPPSHYDTLHLRSDASPQQVRKAYRRLAQHYHPDRATGTGRGDTMARINQAYQVLSDPHRRAEYDSHLRARAAARAAGAQRAAALRIAGKARMLMAAVIAVTVLLLGALAWRALAVRALEMPSPPAAVAATDDAPLPLIPARRIEARRLPSARAQPTR